MHQNVMLNTPIAEVRVLAWQLWITPRAVFFNSNGCEMYIDRHEMISSRTSRETPKNKKGAAESQGNRTTLNELAV